MNNYRQLFIPIRMLFDAVKQLSGALEYDD